MSNTTATNSVLGKRKRATEEYATDTAPGSRAREYISMYIPDNRSQAAASALPSRTRRRMDKADDASSVKSRHEAATDAQRATGSAATRSASVQSVTPRERTEPMAADMALPLKFHQECRQGQVRSVATLTAFPIPPKLYRKAWNKLPGRFRRKMEAIGGGAASRARQGTADGVAPGNQNGLCTSHECEREKTADVGMRKLGGHEELHIERRAGGVTGAEELSQPADKGPLYDRTVEAAAPHSQSTSERIRTSAADSKSTAKRGAENHAGEPPERLKTHQRGLDRNGGASRSEPGKRKRVDGDDCNEDGRPAKRPLDGTTSGRAATRAKSAVRGSMHNIDPAIESGSDQRTRRSSRLADKASAKSQQHRLQ
ncbi:hypothetical protein OBBRIDRAFT_395802 [Obba rivulosa]|uniref:Uncharacterized protein n=1 Tax=Obba rivulosa TaxID=1052685 RepID=A0A8E2AJK2_9APHY|nr:hypothetical protein OBBRIDRAFT_395802 [Obba rivulosa]